MHSDDTSFKFLTLSAKSCQLRKFSMKTNQTVEPHDLSHCSEATFGRPKTPFQEFGQIQIKLQKRQRLVTMLLLLLYQNSSFEPTKPNLQKKKNKSHFASRSYSLQLNIKPRMNLLSIGRSFSNNNMQRTHRHYTNFSKVLFQTSTIFNSSTNRIYYSRLADD